MSDPADTLRRRIGGLPPPRIGRPIDLTGRPRWAAGLARLRLRNGLSQRDVATALGVTVAYISNLEHGFPVSVRQLVRIVAVIDRLANERAA